MYCRGEREVCERAAGVLFPRPLTVGEWIALSAAPNGAHVTIGIDGDGLLLDAMEPVRLGLISLCRIERDRMGKTILTLEDWRILRKKERGKGGGRRLFRRLAASARSLGIAKIEAVTRRVPGENGWYTLPRFGFDAPLPPETLDKLPESFAASRTLLDLTATIEGRLWWRENGHGAELTFDLSENSRALRRFAN